MSCLSALENFINKYHVSYSESSDKFPSFYPLGEASDCIVGDYDENTENVVHWKATQRSSIGTFDNIEKALELSLCSDIEQYFGHYYSGPMTFDSQWGAGELLQPWNQDDFERLQKNIIGHLMMKKKLKQPPTWFVGVMDDADKMITVNNENGSVWLETAGEQQSAQLADSLSEFLERLNPKVMPATKPQLDDNVSIEHPGIISNLKRMWANLFSRK
ncbi:MAG: SecY-interacting protein [Shewanella sp.]|nr:SecY-interacting protein [Shewanella sp.]